MNIQTDQTKLAKEGRSIAPETHIGLTALDVADLERSVDFYTDVLGFRVLSREAGAATLGTPSTPLLVLHEKKDARPRSPFTTGLYHFAILVPSRAALARSLKHMAETQYPIDGAADHLVSEALYLTDPDGNGIEVYRDRARDEWPRRNGHIQMASDPLDFDGIVGELETDTREWGGLEEGTTIGHMHLQVADIKKAEQFYHDVLGFDVVVYWPSALFISAGGYHHHIGMNTWQTLNGPQAPADAAGMRYFTVVVPDEAEQGRIAARLAEAGIAYKQADGVLTVSDPWNNKILFTTGK